MPNSITLTLDKGGATGIDPTLIKRGQLQEAEGAAYGVSDPAVRKIGGRVAFNASAPSANPVNGINFNGFDAGTDYITAQINGTLYGAPSTTGVFVSARTGLTASASNIDRTKFADQAFMCNGIDTNWVHKSNNTTFRMGLDIQPTTPGATLVAGPGLTGTYQYWTTEVDLNNGVEGATANTGAAVTITPANQTVRITRPAVTNSSATQWYVYRTVAGGSFPVGWQIASIAIATTTYDDVLPDSALVLNAVYPIVSINDIPESQNYPPPVLRSIATFEGSICGVLGRSLYYSETATPHYFPASYVLNFRPTWGGQARCVRPLNKVLMVFFDNDSFRVNTLPKAADSFFDAGVVQEHIANFGTASPLGACRFSGWGGTEMMFFWDRNGPMITDGNAFDFAVANIDATVIPPTSLGTIECHDNPAHFRIEVTYLDANSQYRRLDFYYDGSRITQERGFPELAWTGPHLVPGPGTYGILNGVGVVWAGSRYSATYGKVYQEDSGYSDAANIVDSSGTINFRARTNRFYAEDINSQGTVGRVFVHKSSTSTGTYSVTVNAWREGDTNQPVATTHAIDATTIGATSDYYNRSGQSFDIRIVRDDAVFMPPINNVTCMIKSVGEFVKTNR